MNRFLHYLRAFRFWARTQPLCPQQAPAWTDGDAQILAGWFGSHTGRKLILTLRYQEQAINASAVCRTTDHAYNCGYAAGFRAGAAMLQSLSAHVPPHPDDHSENADGADAFAERHAP